MCVGAGGGVSLRAACLPAAEPASLRPFGLRPLTRRNNDAPTLSEILLTICQTMEDMREGDIKDTHAYLRELKDAVDAVHRKWSPE